MKRLEIIGNRSIEEDLFDLFKKNDINTHYTKVPVVFGIGNSDPKMGDHIWPEENFLLIIYCNEEEAEKIIKAVQDLKTFFPNEGIKLFEIPVECSV